MIQLPSLPIDEVLADVLAALDRGRAVVVEAPPGAGKTMRVPPAMLDASWLGDRIVLLLQPRRVAARAVARQLARLDGSRLGDRIGLVTRDERKVSASTRLLVATEGVLLRRLQKDPSIGDVGAVVFDEFHERSSDADLGLAMTLEVAQALRDDLRIVVMSATLPGDRVVALLGRSLDPADVGHVVAEGRMFPVEVSHHPTAPAGRRRDVVDHAAVAAAIEDAAERVDGSVLVFLPGMRDIDRVSRALAGRALPPDVDVVRLHGSLPSKEQDRVLSEPPPGRRRVVLSTAIAETSLTVPSIRAVVDAGWSRVPRFDPGTGLTRLATVRASRAEIEQRSGRAGRVASGIAIRVWPTSANGALEEQPKPEVLQSDLAGVVLAAAAWGVDTVEDLVLLDPLPEPAVIAAVEMLVGAGALAPEPAGNGALAVRLTDTGRRLAAIPAHPRLAHVLLVGAARGHGALAATLAALVNERDVLSGPARRSSDLVARVRAVAHGAGAHDRDGARRVRRERDRLLRHVSTKQHGQVPDGDALAAEVAVLCALGWPDRVGIRRGRHATVLLASGRGAMLDDGDPLVTSELVVALDVGGGGRDARIRLATPIDRDVLLDVLRDRVVTVDHVAHDPSTDRLLAERRRMLGSIILQRAPLADPPRAAVHAALLDAIRSRGLVRLPWTPKSTQLRGRLALLHRVLGEPWPDTSDEALLDRLEDWIQPFLLDARRPSDLARIDLHTALLSLVGGAEQRAIGRLAPTRLALPSGRQVAVDYPLDGIPVLAGKLQEFFGATDGPAVVDGRVPVVLHLLSPAQRPLAVTGDLAAFWAGAYAAVRSENRGRYRKHPWPEDPLTAPPSRHVTHRRR